MKITKFRRKISARLQELQEQLEQANAKILSLDKARQRLLGELDDAQVDVERVWAPWAIFSASDIHNV